MTNKPTDTSSGSLRPQRGVNRDDVPYAMKGYYPRPKRPGPDDPTAIKDNYPDGIGKGTIIAYVFLSGALLAIITIVAIALILYIGRS